LIASVLIANRGEIACRIIRTAKRLGIRTVAVYSEADARSPHVCDADDAVCIGPAAARDSYLSIDRILAAAAQTDARAIHPGYGFLSENEEFARACVDAGLIFVGPSPDAIRIMGSKSESKTVMEKAGVPVVPGHKGSQDSQRLAVAAQQIGYPVLVKASAGGGGKGMRVVESDTQILEAIEGARREARSSFGDDELLIEKFLPNARHVEVQVFSDAHGNFVHLFERDCSVQRRHQKIIEESPAPHLDPALRAAMGQSAVAAARAVDYVGAGTVEFLLKDGVYYFIEMNTRLQVEHAVTEMVTGVDLVEWQFRVAAGEALPLQQPRITVSGHAIEARVYAEDPANEFLPAAGRITHIRMPAESRHVRIDTGLAEGDVIGVHYDPMIAKLIVWDRNRARAIEQLSAALAAYQVAPLLTNIPFLKSVARHAEFRAGGVGTAFVENHLPGLLDGVGELPEELLGLAAVAIVLRSVDAEESLAGRVRKLRGIQTTPWAHRSGWRLNGDNHHRLTVIHNDESRELVVHYRTDGYDIDLTDTTVCQLRNVTDDGRTLSALLDDRSIRATVIHDGRRVAVFADKALWHLSLAGPKVRTATSSSASGRLLAPMPGTVTAVEVASGEEVSTGQTLLVVEAMKMEHAIKSPVDGVIGQLACAPGEQVLDGQLLIVVNPAPDPIA
jgi:3-methylcrotonyl-CoA carboxylase alpha subunit